MATTGAFVTSLGLGHGKIVLGLIIGGVLAASLWPAIGLAAGRLGGERMSLGFVVETERQVEAHLDGHLRRLPAADAPSRAIVAQMKADEERHADEALDAGGTPLPQPLPGLMRLAARVMTGTAHYL